MNVNHDSSIGYERANVFLSGLGAFFYNVFTSADLYKAMVVAVMCSIAVAVARKGWQMLVAWIKKTDGDDWG